jgi:hypothetical protein
MVFPPLVLDHFPIFGPQLLSVNDVSDEVNLSQQDRETGQAGWRT